MNRIMNWKHVHSSYSFIFREGLIELWIGNKVLREKINDHTICMHKSISKEQQRSSTCSDKCIVVQVWQSCYNTHHLWRAEWLHSKIIIKKKINILISFWGHFHSLWSICIYCSLFVSLSLSFFLPLSFLVVCQLTASKASLLYQFHQKAI